MARQKYFKTRQEASKAAREYGLMGYQGLCVWKMLKCSQDSQNARADSV